MLRRQSPEEAAGRQLSELYAEHGRASYAFAYHLTGSREDSEDLVQTAFLAAHGALVRGEGLVNPRAWLLTAVKRRAFNLHRDRRELAASDQLEEVAGSSLDSSGAEAQVETVRASLWALPEQQHQAFVLRHWSGLSYAEIAAVLNTTPSAVESLLVRARAGVIADRDLDESCLAVRERLCSDQPLAPLHERHLSSCRGCATASSRLARAAGIAAAVALVPRIHVAQALASTIPGFTTNVAVAGTVGSGAAGSGAAAGAGKALLVKGAIAIVAVTGAVGAAHTHGLRLHGGTPPALPAGRLGANQPPSPAIGGVGSAGGTATPDVDGYGSKTVPTGGGNPSSPSDGSSTGDGAGAGTGRSDPTGGAPVGGDGSGDSAGAGSGGSDTQSSGDSSGSGDTSAGADSSDSDPATPNVASPDAEGSGTSSNTGPAAGD